MTRYLLDTTALIDFSKRREPTHSRILAMIEGGDELGVCAVNVAEFYAGLPPESLPVWDEFIGSLTYWEITWQAAARAGRDRYEFARKGQTISTADALVAAAGRYHHAVVVTDNVKDYPMSDVELLRFGE